MHDYFLKEKSELKDVMKGLIQNLKTKSDINVKYLHSDSAGENVDFKQVCKQEGMGMEFKFTASDIPQQNCHVEWKVAILFNHVCPCSTTGNFLLCQEINFLRNGLWSKDTNHPS